MQQCLVIAVFVAAFVQYSVCLQCYTCRDASSPDQCQSIQTCTAGQSCFLETRPSHSGRLYSMGCQDVQVCAMKYSVLVGRSTTKRQAGLCHQCCSTDNCNINLCLADSGYGVSNLFLMVLDGNTLHQMDAATHTLYRLNLQMSNQMSYPSGFDYDPISQKVYWYGDYDNNIFRQSINNTVNARELFLTDLYINGGFAIDPVSRLLFFSTTSPIAAIKVASLESGKVTTIIDANISRPWSITLDPQKRTIYWSDVSRQTINVANYNGSNRHTIINSDQLAPTSIALDCAHHVLYWADPRSYTIGKANTDGSNIQIVHGAKVTYFTSLALFGNDLYITSSNSISVMNISTRGYQQEPFGKPAFNFLSEIKAYNLSTLNTGRNGCSVGNGGCSQVCLPLTDNSVECICADGYNAYYLSDNTTTCVAEPVVRLAGNNATAWQGRVEVSLDRGATWNTFCNYLSVSDANVICGMLGWERVEATVLSRTFGSANSSIGGLNRPLCSGNERSLIECQNFPYKFGCSHYDDVGINCSIGAKVRLTGGQGKDQGRVEMRFNNEWVKLCDNKFGTDEANVVCGMLGYSRNMYFSEVTSSTYFAQGSTSMSMHLHIRCHGNEHSLLECQHDKVIDFNDCQENEEVFVVCNAAISAQVRLVGSYATSNQGTVEISTDNGITWNTLCDDYFDANEAQVLCNMLGFNRIGASAKSNAYFGQGNSSSTGHVYNCQGAETSILNCDTYAGTCSHSDDAGVICPYSNTEQLRLENGTSANQGRVEISFDNGKTWGTVCGNFDNHGASVVCAALGYPREGATYRGNIYGSGSNRIEPLLRYPVCDGYELALSYCMRNDSKCSHDSDIGVMCLAESTTKVRIAGGFSRGRVEISVDNGTSWGTICNDYFAQDEAKVVCRMLGFNSTGPVAVTNGIYGSGSSSQNILFDDLRCLGDERSILQCKHNAIGENDCTHDEDAGVDCGDISGYVTVRLTGSNNNRTQGRVEIRFGQTNTWGTICDDSFDSNAAGVICAMLGLSRSNAKVSSFGAGESSQPILLDNINCLGNENTVLDCNHSPIGQHDCGHGEDAGVICQT